VRHYHAKGLLPEPERDHSGYRRYDAAAAVELIRIRTLADAGVPLSRVSELLAAGQDEFAAAVEGIDRRLRAEIRERQRSRERIAQLAAGDSLALPPEAVAYLDRLRAIGVPENMVEAERDAWILIAAQLPEQMPSYMEMKDRQLDDPDVVGLYADLADLLEWAPDDPRVEQVVDRLVGQLEAFPTDAWEADDAMSDDLAALLDAVFVEFVPAARRILALMEDRGWTGWTKMKPHPIPSRNPSRQLA
jgi:DNA-binding transcriptional MerR regulator